MLELTHGVASQNSQLGPTQLCNNLLSFV